MTKTQSQDPSLKSEIVRLTNEHWERHHHALLLARVGQYLTRRGYNLRAELRGQKLVPFIEHELAGSVRVINSPNDPLVHGLVPITVTEDSHKLFQVTQEKASSNDRVSFDKRLWVSFSHPIKPGTVRTIEFLPEIRYEDVPIEAANGKLTISSDLVIPIGSKEKVERDADITRNIVEWFKANNLDIALGKLRYRENELSGDGNSALSLFIHALDPKDRERISLPVDIIEKLLHKKIRRN